MGFVIFVVIVALICSLGNNGTWSLNFWNYSSGCSDTCFRCGGKTWKNPEGKGWNSQNYKGVYLHDIHREVCQVLLAILRSKVESMGFTIKNIENDETWLKYYSRVIRITW